jgi:hypothetical protein
MPGQALGIVDFYWGGRKVDIKDDGSFSRGGMVNTEIVVGRQVKRSQKMVPFTANITTVLEDGQVLGDIFPGDAAEVQIHCDTGQVFVSPSAFITDDLEVSWGGSSGIKVTIKGDAALEQS